jgi:multiple sugar transport system substrate-binding protein
MRHGLERLFCILVISVLSVGFSQSVDEWYQPGDYEGRTLNVVISASKTANSLGEVYNELTASFEDATGATVNLIPVPENQMYNQVRLSLLSGACPYDMMETGAGGAKDYGLSGFLEPLPTPPDIDDFFEGDVNQYSIDNELYGMPLYSDTNLLYWRTDLFEEAGLDPNRPPQTYDEFREYAQRLTVDANGKRADEEGFDPNNVEVWGSAFKGSQNLASTWEWYNYLYAWGGDVFDEDYNITVNEPAAVDSLKWVVDNYREYGIYPPGILNFDYTEFQTLFLEGKIAMAINWPYMYEVVQDPESSKVVGKVAVGRKPMQVTHGGNVGGWSMNVFKDCPNQDIAVDFAKWFARPEAARMYAGVGIVPVRKSVLSEVAAEEGQPWQAIQENLVDGQMVSALATGESWMPIEQVLQVAIQRSLTGEATPQQALDQAAEEIAGILDENGFYTDVLGR